MLRNTLLGAAIIRCIASCSAIRYSAPLESDVLLQAPQYVTRRRYNPMYCFRLRNTLLGAAGIGRGRGCSPTMAEMGSLTDQLTGSHLSPSRRGGLTLGPDRLSLAGHQSESRPGPRLGRAGRAGRVLVRMRDGRRRGAARRRERSRFARSVGRCAGRCTGRFMGRFIGLAE